MVFKPKGISQPAKTKSRGLGRKEQYPAARSLDECVSSTLTGLNPVTSDVGQDLDSSSSGFSSYLPTGKQRERRLRAELQAEGYAPTDPERDWYQDEDAEPYAQSLAAAYDAYGVDDDAEPMAHAFPPPSNKSERTAQLMSTVKPMSSLRLPGPVTSAAPVSQVSFAERDALEEEALRELLGSAYESAVGGSEARAPVTTAAPSPEPVASGNPWDEVISENPWADVPLEAPPFMPVPPAPVAPKTVTASAPKLASASTKPRAHRFSNERAVAAPMPKKQAPVVKDLDDVSSSVGLHPDLAEGTGRRCPVRSLEDSASKVSLPWEQEVSGYSVALDDTGVGANRQSTRRSFSQGKRGKSSYSGASLESSSSTVTLPLGAILSPVVANEEKPSTSKGPERRRFAFHSVGRSLDDSASTVTLPLGRVILPQSEPEAAPAKPAAQANAAASVGSGAQDEVSLAYNEMLRLLTQREYSACELERKCRQRFSAEAIAAALARCQEQGLQSDERYADMLVRHMRFALYGRYKLKLEALRKGVAWSLVEAAIASNELDWYELAWECLSKKYRPADLSDYKTWVKANGYLGRRGFESAEREYALKRLRAQGST